MPWQSYSIDTNGQTVTWAAPLNSVNGSLAKLGAGTLILAGSNTYSGGTTVNAGVLELATTAALPGYPASLSNVSVAGGATLAVPVGGAGDWNDDQIRTLAAANWVNNSAALGLDTSHGDSTFGGGLAQPLTLAKLGANTLTLTGANANSGGTQINAGILNINGDAVLGAASAPLTFTGNGTLQAGVDGIALNSNRAYQHQQRRDGHDRHAGLQHVDRRPDRWPRRFNQDR